MIVKICGITRLEDALVSLENGANALGFNFWPSSPRFIRPETAETITEEARRAPIGCPFLAVGVLIGRDGWEETRTDVLQFHGLKSPAEAPATGRRHWFATSWENVSDFPDAEIVIDSSWGAGRLADWTRLTSLDRPYILSGGLTPDNVGEAIQLLRPAGVDVCSGVESAPGQKDPEKIKRFLKEVQRVLG